MVLPSCGWSRPVKAHLVLLALAWCLPAAAQQAVNADLDACIHEVQRTEARKGAVLGFLGGLGGGVAGVRQGDGGSVGIHVGVGTASGGALGLAVAYYTAVDSCLKKNPSWIPASRLERSAQYADAVAKHAYEPRQGIVMQALGIEGPSSVVAGAELVLQGRLLLLTPLGDEQPVEIERRFFVRSDKDEKALRHLGHTQERRVLGAGEHLDEARLPIPGSLPAGVEFRYVLLVRMEGMAPSVAVHTVVVR